MCGIYSYDKCLRCGRGNILYISEQEHDYEWKCKNCNHVNRKLNKLVKPRNLKRRVSLGWIPLEELKNYEKKLKRDIIVILVGKNASILRSMYFFV